ncbi:MAG: hypothetical protein ABSB82_10570 [Terriglobia bacterium]|jgi:hypothetical protein
MPKQIPVAASLLLLLASVAAAQTATETQSPAPASAAPPAVTGRVMEAFNSQLSGATAVIFHQRDKADGPRLGELILAHSGEEVEFETTDGKRHRATLFRLKSCFGRGLLLFPSSKTKLAENDDFVLRFPGRN